MAAIFAGEGLIFLGFGSLFLFSAVVSDFIVPSLALENTTIGEAFRRFFTLVRNEVGQFSVYVLLKIGLGIAGYMAQAIIFYELVEIQCICGSLLRMGGSCGVKSVRISRFASVYGAFGALWKAVSCAPAIFRHTGA